MSSRETDLSALKRDVHNAEAAVIELNRQITEAIVSKRPTGSLSTELDEITEFRDLVRSRLTRLEKGIHNG